MSMMDLLKMHMSLVYVCVSSVTWFQWSDLSNLWTLAMCVVHTSTQHIKHMHRNKRYFKKSLKKKHLKGTSNPPNQRIEAGPHCDL